MATGTSIRLDWIQYGFNLPETWPSFCTVVPDPNWKACHQHIRLATNMKFAMQGSPKHLIILNWREIDNFIDFLQNKSQFVFPRPLWPYDRRKQLWKNFCIKIICQSHHTHYHFNTTSDKIYMDYKTLLSNIPLIDSNIHQYATVVLSRGRSCRWAWGG
jgi:hypothetical protein